MSSLAYASVLDVAEHVIDLSQELDAIDVCRVHELCDGGFTHLQHFGDLLDNYAAHKSWDAVAKDAAAGARQLRKPEIVQLGMTVLDGFTAFWKECDKHLTISLNPYAKRYNAILEENVNELKRLGHKPSK